MKKNKENNIEIIFEKIEEENFKSNPSSLKSSNRVIGDSSENVSFSNISKIDISDSFSKSLTENKIKKTNLGRSIVFVKNENNKKRKKKLNKSFSCKEDEFDKNERSTSKIKVGHNIKKKKKKIIFFRFKKNS